MIRLYLSNYKPAELVQLCNVIFLACSTVVVDALVNPAKDLDELFVYLVGYMGGKGGK